MSAISDCGNAALLTGPSSPPAGAVTLSAGTNNTSTASYQLTPSTTYWLAPGIHTLGTDQFAQFQPDPGDTFIGAPGAIITGQHLNDSAFVNGAKGVTIEYLTIENFVGAEGQMVVNASGAPTWTVSHDTIQNNGGAGVGLASGSVVEYDCLTHNQEYGFSSFGTSHTATLSHDEISFNDATGAYDRPTLRQTSIQCGCSGRGEVLGDDQRHSHGQLRPYKWQCRPLGGH